MHLFSGEIMVLSNFYQRALFVCCVSLFSWPSNANQNQSPEEKAEPVIRQLYHSLNNKPKSNTATRIEMISAQFLGKPYLLGALGEGVQGQYDQSPLYRVDAFDCETYVDTVLGIAFADNAVHFKQCINQVRYRNGQVSFMQRNHFTCLDWNQNNQRQGFVKDITTTIRDKNNQSVVQVAEAFIDKPSWYSHFTTHMIRLNRVDPDETTKRLQSLKREGKKLSATGSALPYIPLSALFDSKGRANDYLFKQIPNAAIIEIVRPNWDLSKEIGTHLNISHLGFVIWKKGILYFRDASSAYNRVVDTPLIEYLRHAQKSPTVKGINIQIVLPQSRMDCEITTDA